MKLSLFLLAACLAATLAALQIPGAQDFAMISILAAIAAALLVLRSAGAKTKPRQKVRKGPKGDGRDVILDGSNIMYWDGTGPNMDPVIAAVAAIRQRGLRPIVYFDANAGYLMTGRYRHDQFFANMLNLLNNEVTVSPKGIPADPLILAHARDVGGRVLSNDKFRDWAEDYPLIRSKGHLITGSVINGRVRIDLPSTPPSTPASTPEKTSASAPQ